MILIILDHLIEWPTGGFVAVDTFFVLSGFLITGLLLKEYDATGRIEFGLFIRRRIRRLMPSALIVLVVTVAAGYFVFISSRALSTLWDAIWVVLFVSNWNFAVGGTDYFATSLPQSALLHFWSLSVEEQFYFVWPFLVAAMLVIGAAVTRTKGWSRQLPEWQRYGTIRPDEEPLPRRTLASRLPLIAVIVVVVIASFCWAVYQSDTNLQVSYLSTFTRVWAIGVGALLCFAVRLFRKIPDAARPVLAWGGFITIMVCAALYEPSVPYPGVASLVPVAATCAIIAAGTGGTSRLIIAENPVAVYLGKISYSVYLWHWPIFVVASVIVGKESPWYLFFAPALALVLAVLTTRFIEDPIRKSGWLEPAGSRRVTLDLVERRTRRRQLGFSLGISVVAMAVVIVVVTSPRIGSNESLLVALPTTMASASASDQNLAVEQQKLQTQIVAGLDATSWPDNLNPGLDSLARKAWAPQWTKDGCLDTSDANMSSCVYGDASLPKTAVLLGDSTAISYMPGLAPALNAQGYRVHVLTHAECPTANVQVLGANPNQPTAGFPKACDDLRTWSIAKTVELNPDLIVITDGQVELHSMVEKGDISSLLATWKQGMVDTLSQLAPLKSSIVMLSAPPQATDLSSCATRLNTPKDCTASIDAEWWGLLKANQDAASTASAGRADPVRVIDTSEWFCSAQSTCPGFAGDTTIRADQLHLTAAYAAELAPIMELTVAEPAGT